METTRLRKKGSAGMTNNWLKMWLMLMVLSPTLCFKCGSKRELLKFHILPGLFRRLENQSHIETSNSAGMELTDTDMNKSGEGGETDLLV